MMKGRKETDEELSRTEIRYHPDLPGVEARSTTLIS